MANLTKINDFFAAFASKNVAVIRDTMAEDIVWRIPGHHPLSGEKRGIDEVLAFFNELAAANFKAERLAIAENGDFVIQHHHAWSEAGNGLDLKWCLVFRFEDGKIKEVIDFCEDQHKADLFFWEIYKLKPVPERLLK